jgi:hypothetical protein
MSYDGVRQHLCRYFDAVDRADLDAVLDLLGDATVHLGDRVVTGRAGLAALYGPRLVAPAADGRRRTAHHLTNLVVTGEGPVRAAASYLRLEEGLVLTASGRVEQELEPAGAGWRVLTHRVVADL